ncbi:MAG: homoserine O-acetyltransferase [bacterium]
MNTPNPDTALGLVETRTVQVPLPPGGLTLENGGVLPELVVAYEAYGNLSPARDNVVFICHALTGDAHAAGCHSPDDRTPGWWDDMIGPGKGLDTNHFHVICANILGGCKGTTGPASINPATGQPYGAAFPAITIGDIVDAHYLFLKHLGITRLRAIVGGSFGGMLVLEWGIRYPDVPEHCLCIASAASLSAQALAFDIVGREMITNDPGWSGGNYYGTGKLPKDGLAAARMLGHITYLSPEIMTRKFGRKKKDPAPGERFSTRFEVESYLQYQGEKFVERFDSNSYLHITHAMDSYDLVEKYGDLKTALGRIKARVLVVALSSDWLFPPEQSIEIASALVQLGKPVSYCLLKAPYGHDAFLMDIEHLSQIICTFIGGCPDCATAGPAKKRDDYELIANLIEPGSRVLDLGCGDGDLLSLLATNRQTAGMGVDIDLQHLIAAMNKKLDVLQGDIDSDLSMIPDQSYDYVVLSQTLQVVRRPRAVLHQMLRIAREGIVSFPNFANWHNRMVLGLTGRMPKTEALPFEWYNTPNIHLATWQDFLSLCRQDGIRVKRIIPMTEKPLSRLFVAAGLKNLGAERILVNITRS